MKINIIKASFAALATLALASCSEGQYWESPSNPGEVYAFDKPAQTISIPADQEIPSSYEVTVSRSTNGGEVTVPVELKTSSPLLSGAADVTFAAGSYTSTYTINIAAGAKAGVNYTAQINLPQPEDALTIVKKENRSFTLSLSKVLVLEWVSAGTASTMSKWASNETAIDIPVEQATNWPFDGQRLMRLVSPYWYLEPSFAEEGYNIEYLIDNDGKAIDLKSKWNYMGEFDPEEGYFFFGGMGEFGSAGFYNQEDIYVMDGVVGTAATPTATTADGGWYETLIFQWSDYGK